MAPRTISIEQNVASYVLHFSKLEKAWAVYNDFVRCLHYINEEHPKQPHITLAFAESEGALYPQLAVSIAAIIDYYERNFGWSFYISSTASSYVSATHIVNPFTVSSDRKVLKRAVFNKVIRFQNAEEAGFVSREYYRQLMRLFVVESGVLAGLTWCINEIMDNVFIHSGAKHGYIMGEIHPRSHVITIAVCDLGCGLFASLNKSDSINPRDELDAIQLATEKGITEDSSFGQGYGLYGLQRIIQENSSHFAIMTGHSAQTYDFRDGSIKPRTKIPVVSQEALGTRVEFALNYSSKIDLRRALEGHETYQPIHQDIEALEYGNVLNYLIAEHAQGDFGTRETGKILRNELINIMKNNETRIRLDFSNVPMVSSSFSDELLGKLIMQIGFIAFNQRFILYGTSNDVVVVLEHAIGMRAKG